MEEQVDGAMDTALVSRRATTPVIVWGLAKGLWQAGKTEWFRLVTLQVRMEKPRTFLLSRPVRIQ